ncbi:MAG: hypothetical protein AB7O37_06720 [Vicinamibacteria bacterium]
MNPGRPHLERLLREACVALFFLALAAVATRPLVLDAGSSMFVGPDPVIDLWTLHWLSGHLPSPAQLFQGDVFYPVRHAVLHSDISLGSVVLAAPLRLLTSEAVPLYNAAVLLALAFGGWAFCALARELTGRLDAGLLAGTLAAFGSHQLYHVYHLNLLTIGWLALLLLALQRLLERPGPGAVVLAGVSFALSAQSSGYYAVGAALLAAAFGLWHARALLRARALRAVLAAAALGVLLTLPYLLAFLDLRAEQGLRRPAGMSRRMAFQPARDLSSHGYLYGAVLGREGERLFPGLLSLGLAGLALARRPRHAGFYAAAVAGLLLVSLGPDVELLGRRVPLPYAALFALPPLDAMRHPYTFAALATMLLAVLAGLGWASLAAQRPAVGRFGPVLVALALAETFAPGAALREVPEGVPPAYELLRKLPPGPLLEIPLNAPDALLWAARHGLPMVNGDGAFLPGRHAILNHQINIDWLRDTPASIDDTRPMQILQHEIQARWIIVPCGRNPGLLRLCDAFDRSTSVRFEAAAPDGDRVYEVVRDAAPAR